jgi:light-regulated signal transduction histidine kinase (bacteriophytochrome)
MAARKLALPETADRIPGDARLEDFANAVAHDLQEPLRTISTCTELFLREMNVKDNGKVQAQFIRDGVARMSVLLEGLRAFALSGFEEPQPNLNLGQVVKDVLLDLQGAIGVSGAIVTVGPLPFVRANEKHLQRVLQNLIANAIKYRSQARLEIDVSAELLGTDCMIRITDNGVGIEPEYHEQIFVIFKRLHGREIPGVGIGLAICAKLIQATGGAIWVESKAGAGASFCFTVPAAAQPVRRAVAA